MPRKPLTAGDSGVHSTAERHSRRDRSPYPLRLLARPSAGVYGAHNAERSNCAGTALNERDSPLLKRISPIRMTA